MAYITKTVPITANWTLVTNKVALLQFNDKMHMVITSGAAPSESVGFVMSALEKYVNTTDGLSIWAKALAGGSGNESVRVAEDVL